MLHNFLSSYKETAGARFLENVSIMDDKNTDKAGKCTKTGSVVLEPFKQAEDWTLKIGGKIKLKILQEAFTSEKNGNASCKEKGLVMIDYPSQRAAIAIAIQPYFAPAIRTFSAFKYSITRCT